MAGCGIAEGEIFVRLPSKMPFSAWVFLGFDGALFEEGHDWSM